MFWNTFILSSPPFVFSLPFMQTIVCLPVILFDYAFFNYIKRLGWRKPLRQCSSHWSLTSVPMSQPPTFFHSPCSPLSGSPLSGSPLSGSGTGVLLLTANLTPVEALRGSMQYLKHAKECNFPAPKKCTFSNLSGLGLVRES